MSDYTLYETCDGRIHGTVSMSVDDCQKAENGFAYIKGKYNQRKQYIKDERVLERPAMKVRITMDEEYLEVSGIPEDTSVEINGLQVNVIEADGKFSWRGDESYTCVLRNFPYKDRTILVHV